MAGHEECMKFVCERGGSVGIDCLHAANEADAMGVEVPACDMSAALQTYSSNASYLPYCRRIPTFMLTPCLRGMLSSLLPWFLRSRA